MGASTMSRRITTAVTALAFLALAGGRASAQFGRYGGFGLGPGSTVQGDIARGMGVMAYGMGSFNLSTAMANSINTDTAIKWNQYVYLSLEEDNRKKAIHRAARIARNKENYELILARIRESPNLADLRTGDALNAVLEQLLDPKLDPSSLRRSNVPLAGPTIRKIPFLHASEAATFSMLRLNVKNDWPLALRGENFARERRAYERAIDNALEQDIEGKLSLDAVVAVQSAVEDLQYKADRVIPQASRDLSLQAKNYLKKLANTAQMLKSPVVEDVLAAVEKYPGTTVGDLLAFMQRYNLRFGAADTPDERELYRTLYISLRVQRDGVKPPEIRPDAEEQGGPPLKDGGPPLKEEDGGPPLK
jgi:hypothetical protein